MNGNHTLEICVDDDQAKPLLDRLSSTFPDLAITAHTQFFAVLSVTLSQPLKPGESTFLSEFVTARKIYNYHCE